ncbi:response regulator [Ammoniphilus sp. YIM 78166]|uniref:response regulator n=1 Tax=Ammoniphilus sp. YIM 78166 TaxID=1644106 RepID=UPI00106FCA86|nr:response regulator [Ammoniphilus sp. YIM 78166]
MKLLIIDDENPVRKSIRLLVDWTSLGIQTIWECQNGMEAIELMETVQPDIIITDIMMPLKDGLELMDWMKTHQVDANIIVISGFDDFDFVRQTLKHGAVDYLLKPINPQHLMDAAKKAIVKRIESQESKMKQKELVSVINELKPAYLDKFFSNLLIKPEMESSPHLYRELLDLFHPCYCQVAVTHNDLMDEKDSLSKHFIELCNEYLWSQKKGYAFRNLHQSNEIVIIFWDDLESTSVILDKVTIEFWNKYQNQSEIGLGSITTFPTGLSLTYQQALSAAKHCNLLHPTFSRVHVFDGQAHQMSTLRFGEFKEELRLAVRSGNKENIHMATQRWINYLSQLKQITFLQYKSWLDDYHITKCTWLEEFVQKEHMMHLAQEKPSLRFPYDASKNFSLPHLQLQLTKDLQEFSKILLEYRAQSGNVMQEISKYIKNNYREVTLTDISNHFHLNREHISRRFRQEFGTTIVNYVSQIRIEKAKVLLMNPHLKIAEVGKNIGYEDEKYFSRVFKRTTGLSPKEYRDHISLKSSI